MKKNFVLLLLLCFCLSVSAQQMDLVNVQASKMQKQIPNNVIKPLDYSTAKQYPVVYLLHGFGGNHNDWPNIVPQIKQLATQYQLILVCPNGANSWYFDSPVDAAMQYETYITKDLVEYIDANYSTLKTKNGRAITGLSMGGHGSLYLAIRHRNLFSVAGAMSGGVDVTKTSQQFELAKILGPLEGNEERWRSSSVMGQVDNLKNRELNIIYDCGVEDMFNESNSELHDKLLAKGIEHDYINRPGNHNWDYWTNAINYQLLYIKFAFDRLASTEVADGKMFFYDSPTVDKYDPSWASVTAPSLLPELTAGKFVVDTAVKYSGGNSLRLRWTSLPGGAWSACVAPKGWAESDLSRISEVRFWIHSAEKIEADKLPLVYFQNTQYATSGKVKMGEYLGGVLEANTWTEVAIPVSDFVKDAPTYNLRTSKSVFFGQNETDGAEHTLNIDYITLANDPNYQPAKELLIFDDSVDNLFYDQSWVDVTEPSVIFQPANHKEKLAVETSIKYEGTNSLRLSYTSAEGGNWLALAAAIGWTLFDLTVTDYELRFYTYSSTPLTAEQLPLLYFEAQSGGTSGQLKMGDYLSDLKANEWTEVIIPISDFQVANPAFAKWHVIKGLFLKQNTADGVEHTIYLDKMRFLEIGSSLSVSTSESNNTPTIHYANKTIHYTNQPGMVKIIDTYGVEYLSFQASEKIGSQSVSLSNGLYIAVTDKGNYKFIVR